MKKILLICLIFPCLTACCNEIIDDYFDIAANYCTYGKYQDALVYLDKIIETDNSNQEAKELKETILRVLNKNEKSYLTSKNKNIYEFERHKKNGDLSNQITSLSSNSNDFWSNFILAQFYRQNNDLKNSITYYQKAININPNYPQTYLGIAQSYANQNDYENAIKYLNKYLTYNKNSDIAYALRAEANLQLNNISQAKQDIQKAIAIECNINYSLIEAKILYYTKDYNKSKKQLDELSKTVQTSEIYKYIGLCDYATGNYANALLNINNAIILSDDDKTLISKYNEIKSKLDKQ